MYKSNQCVILLLIYLFISIGSSIGQNEQNYYIHTVTKEDKSLWGICQKHNVLLEDVKAINQLENNSIEIGKKIKIPKQIQLSNKGTRIQYIVKRSGESLDSLSSRYALSKDSLMAFNRLSDEHLEIGQQIMIPTHHLNIHIVKKNDKSLWRISKLYGVELNALKQFNHKENNLIRNGELILMPRAWLRPKSIPSSKNENEAWELLGKPIFNIEQYWNRFKFYFPDSIYIVSNNELNELNPLDYFSLYQHATLSSSFEFLKTSTLSHKKYYYYAVHDPVGIDIISMEYVSKDVFNSDKVEHGYLYEVLSILEYDSINSNSRILQVFIYRDHKGNLEAYFGKPNKGTFSCCKENHPLAVQITNENFQKNSYSKFIGPSIVKNTEIIQKSDNNNKLVTDSTTLILRLESFDIPSLIDMESFRNGKQTEAYIRLEKRKKLGY